MLLAWFGSGVEAGVRAGFGCFDRVANTALKGVAPKSVPRAEKYECRQKVSRIARWIADRIGVDTTPYKMRLTQLGQNPLATRQNEPWC